MGNLSYIYIVVEHCGEGNIQLEGKTWYLKEEDQRIIQYNRELYDLVHVGLTG